MVKVLKRGLRDGMPFKVERDIEESEIDNRRGAAKKKRSQRMNANRRRGTGESSRQMPAPLDFAPDALLAFSATRQLSSERTVSPLVEINDGRVSKWFDQSLNQNHVVQSEAKNRPYFCEGGSIVWPTRDPAMHLRSVRSVPIRGASVMTQFAIMKPYELPAGETSVLWFLMREAAPYDEAGLLCYHEEFGTMLDFEHVDETWERAWRVVQTAHRPAYRGQKMLYAARAGDEAWVNGVADGMTYNRPPVPDVEGPFIFGDTNTVYFVPWYGEIVEFLLYERPLSRWQIAAIMDEMMLAHQLGGSPQLRNLRILENGQPRFLENEAPRVIGGSIPLLTNAELREDGSYELREDGSRELRED